MRLVTHAASVVLLALATASCGTNYAQVGRDYGTAMAKALAAGDTAAADRIFNEMDAKSKTLDRDAQLNLVTGFSFMAAKYPALGNYLDKKHDD